jgi:nucleotide-binding universal stress UspA family protein
MSKTSARIPLSKDTKVGVVFNKVLLPTDFTATEKPAWLSAMHLAGLHDGEVIVQHVVSDDIPRFAHVAVAFDGTEVEKHVSQCAEKEMKTLLTRLAGRVPARPVLSRGEVVKEICSLAEKEDVDLIVMGAADGAIACKVIRTTPRPVLTFPSRSALDADAKPFKIERILVATDLSAHSRELVRYAFRVKEVFDIPIHLLYVIETAQAIEFAITHGLPVQTIEKMKEWALKELRSLIPEEYVGDPSVVISVERGSASQTVAAMAQTIGGCLTIVGTHRHSFAHPHLRGTTNDRLLTSIESPVLALKL